MKIIFLDFDGVMCLSHEWGGRKRKKHKFYKLNPNSTEADMPASVKMDNFNKGSIDILNSILLETGADIVVSSDWKLYCSLDELKLMFQEYGIIKSPIDITPIFLQYQSKSGFSKEDLEHNRISEIKDWLKQHPEITHWVAVDDLDLGEKFGPISGNSNGGLKNFVLTPKSSEGIKQCGVKEKILKFLK
jgi:hypothetical protein